MAKTLKTAPELERYILIELRKCAACASIAAVTVSVTTHPLANWEISHVNAVGGQVPGPCLEICDAAVERLREQFDLVIEIEPEEI